MHTHHTALYPAEWYAGFSAPQYAPTKYARSSNGRPASKTAASAECNAASGACKVCACMRNPGLTQPHMRRSHIPDALRKFFPFCSTRTDQIRSTLNRQDAKYTTELSTQHRGSQVMHSQGEATPRNKCNREVDRAQEQSLHWNVINHGKGEQDGKPTQTVCSTRHGHNPLYPLSATRSNQIILRWRRKYLHIAEPRRPSAVSRGCRAMNRTSASAKICSTRLDLAGGDCSVQYCRRQGRLFVYIVCCSIAHRVYMPERM